MTAAPLPLAITGLALLALSMARHAGRAGLRNPSSRPLKAGGWLVLAGSLGLHLLEPRPQIGIVQWVGELTLAGGIVLLLLTVRPRLLPRAALAMAAAALLCPIIGLV